MPLRRRSIFAPILFSFLAPLAFASSYMFTTVVVPPSTVITLGSGGREYLTPYGINNSGQIIGDVFRYISVGESNRYSFAYLYTGGTFTALVDPEFINQTAALAINDLGQIVGAAGFPAFGGPGTRSVEVGFLYSGGTFTHFSNPSLAYTLFSGINNNGQIVGSGIDRSGNMQGFLYSGGIYTPLGNAPDGKPFIPTAINDAGQILGYAQELYKKSYLYSGGSFTQISFPGATQTSVSGFNNAGQIVGAYFLQPTGSYPVGFVYAGGTFTPITYPGDSMPEQSVEAINNRGEILVEGPGLPQSIPLPFGAQQLAIGTPVSDSPEPSTVALTLGAFVSLGFGKLRGHFRRF